MYCFRRALFLFIEHFFILDASLYCPKKNDQKIFPQVLVLSMRLSAFFVAFLSIFGTFARTES